MTFVNIEKLAGCKVIVMTGRGIHILMAAHQLLTEPLDGVLCYPGANDYFLDYPDIVEHLKEELDGKSDTVIIATQSAEFLDCLLESDLEFTLATVRRYAHDENGMYRLRVLSKEEALDARRSFDIELRV